MVQSSPPSWANEVIQNWSEVFSRGSLDVMDFVTCEAFESAGAMDMRLVVGQFDHYAGQTWRDAVLSPQYKPGKMKSVLRQYDENPSYYFSGEMAGGMCLSSLNGGPWFSVSGGNHRTVAAKFACELVHQETGVYPMVRGVAKHRYEADLGAMEAFGALQALADRGIHVSLKRERGREVSAEGAKVIHYQLAFYVCDSRFGHNMRAEWLGAAELRRYARHLLKSNALVGRTERLRHFWRWFICSDSSRLIY